MSEEQQPWMVLAAKPTPLAGLLEPVNHDNRAVSATADTEDSDNGPRSVDEGDNSLAP